MSPDEATHENARDVAAIVNAMLTAKDHDARRTAVGLLAIIQMLVNDDAVGRVALATLLSEAAVELLRGIAVDQLNDTVAVPHRWN